MGLQKNASIVWLACSRVANTISKRALIKFSLFLKDLLRTTNNFIKLNNLSYIVISLFFPQ